MVYRTAFFWLLWLPLGATWSLDSRIRKVAPPSFAQPEASRYEDVGVLTFYLQVAQMYLCNGLLKLEGRSWAWKATASHYALQVFFQLARPSTT
jgi:hypothetical protein